MKAQVKVSPNIIIEVEASKQKDLFKAIASAAEVFGEKKCGCCGGSDIVPVWRTVSTIKGKKTETFEYPEWHCQDPKCRARLALGTINDDSGTLYPQRKLVDGERLPTKEEREQGRGDYGSHKGWHRFKAKKD